MYHDFNRDSINRDSFLDKRLTFLLLQNPECIFIVINESVLAHGGELAGQGTAVGTDVIGQFDASQRERDVAAVLLLRLHRQVCQYLFAQRRLGGDLDPLHQTDTALTQNVEHISGQLLMEGALGWAAVDDVPGGDEEDRSVCPCNKSYIGIGIFLHGKSLPKDIVL